MTLDQIFQAFFAVVPFDLFAGIMALTIVFETLYTFFETFDML
jgi:hypothetical protein